MRLTPHQKRLTIKYEITEEEWERLYKTVKMYSLETKKRDFTYKMLCMGPFTNTRYEKCGVKENQTCQYCGNEKQDFRHLFEECKEVLDLRDRLTARWSTTPSRKEWIIGTENKSVEEKAKSYVIMETNQYIHITNWKGENLSLADLKGKIRGVEYIERQIAMKKMKIEKLDDIFWWRNEPQKTYGFKKFTEIIWLH